MVDSLGMKKKKKQLVFGEIFFQFKTVRYSPGQLYFLHIFTKHLPITLKILRKWDKHF